MQHFDADKHISIKGMAEYGFDYDGNPQLLTAPRKFAIISYQHDGSRERLASQFLAQQQGVLVADLVNDKQLPYVDSTHVHLYVMPCIDKLSADTLTECHAHHHGLIGLANHTYPNSLRLQNMAALGIEALQTTMQLADKVLVLPSNDVRKDFGLMAAMRRNQHAQVLVPQPAVLKQLKVPAGWQTFLHDNPQATWQPPYQTDLFSKGDDMQP